MGIVVDALRRLEERGTGVGAFANAAADAREVRNACAGNVEATRALRESDGCGTLLRLMRDAATSGGKTSEEEEEGRMKSVMFSLQTLVNAGMDDAECLRAAWEAPVIVEALDAVSRLRGKSAAKTHGLLCIFVDTCVKDDESCAPRVLDSAQTFWLSLLRASSEMDEPDGVGGGSHLMNLICTLCCKSDGLPKLFRGLSPNGAEISALNEAMLRARLVALAEDDSRINELESDFHARKTPKLEYVSEQATLLHFVATLMGDKEATSYVDFHHSEVREGEQPPLLLPEGVLAFVLDTTSVVATRFALTEDDDERDVALSLLMECVSILRQMSKREVKPHIGDTIACLAAMGLVRLVLSLLAALPPPEGIGQTSKATGPASAPRLEAYVPEELKSELVYPSKVPWSGYRVDLIAIIGNAAFNRARVCDDVANLGGLPIVLNHTRGEDDEPYLREWALWAVRNMTQASDMARNKISELQPQAIEESEDLLSRGLGVELNRETGKPRVVKREAPNAAVDAVQPEEQGEQPEFAIPENWKITEL